MQWNQLNSHNRMSRTTATASLSEHVSVILPDSLQPEAGLHGKASAKGITSC